MPCLEHEIVILDRKDCRRSERRAGMANSTYLCLAHGDALVHDIANRARFLSHSEFGFARLFPLCVNLCINGPLLRKQIIRVLLCLRRRGPLMHRSEEHTSELQSHSDLVCRLLLEQKKEPTQ